MELLTLCRSGKDAAKFVADSTKAIFVIQNFWRLLVKS